MDEKDEKDVCVGCDSTHMIISPFRELATIHHCRGGVAQNLSDQRTYIRPIFEHFGLIMICVMGLVGKASVTANTGHSPNVDTMSAHRLRRWANIVPILGECSVFAVVESCSHAFQYLIVFVVVRP